MQRMRTMLAVSVALFLLCGGMSWAGAAAPGEEIPAGGTDRWQFSLTPYVWGVNASGKVTIGNYSTSSSMSFSDIMRDMEAAAEIHFEARKGAFGFFLDPTYMKLDQSSTLTAVPVGTQFPASRYVTFTSEMWLVEFGGFYQAGKWLLDGNEKGRKVRVDLIAGGRYWYVHGDLDTGTSSASKTNQFVDPFIGARVIVDITEKLTFRLRGDVGGFGVGSDIAWNGLGGFGYQFSPGVAGLLGYRYLYMDYKTGTSRARYDITMQGPTAGVMFTF